MAIAAAMMMCTNMMAQETQQQPGQQPRQFDPAEMAKNRTETMVKEYGLNEEQAQKLLELNIKQSERMPMMMMGPRGQRGQRPQTGDQQPRRERPQTGEQPRQPRGDRPQMSREDMQKAMEEYNAELQKIMTEEQYKKYQEAQAQRRQMGPRGQRGQGQRPMQRPNND